MWAESVCVCIAHLQLDGNKIKLPAVYVKGKVFLNVWKDEMGLYPSNTWTTNVTWQFVTKALIKHLKLHMLQCYGWTLLKWYFLLQSLLEWILEEEGTHCHTVSAPLHSDVYLNSKSWFIMQFNDDDT